MTTHHRITTIHGVASLRQQLSSLAQGAHFRSLSYGPRNSKLIRAQSSLSHLSLPKVHRNETLLEQFNAHEAYRCYWNASVPAVALLHKKLEIIFTTDRRLLHSIEGSSSITVERGNWLKQISRICKRFTKNKTISWLMQQFVCEKIPFSSATLIKYLGAAFKDEVSILFVVPTFLTASHRENLFVTHVTPIYDIFYPGPHRVHLRTKTARCFRRMASWQ